MLIYELISTRSPSLSNCSTSFHKSRFKAVDGLLLLNSSKKRLCFLGLQESLRGANLHIFFGLIFGRFERRGKISFVIDSKLQLGQRVNFSFCHTFSFQFLLLTISWVSLINLCPSDERNLFHLVSFFTGFFVCENWREPERGLSDR